MKTRSSGRAIGLFEVARAAQTLNDLDDELRGPLAAECDRTFKDVGFPYGCVVCEVEIDPLTGKTKLMEIPSPSNPLGVRAGGESGTTPALAAFIAGWQSVMGPGPPIPSIPGHSVPAGTTAYLRDQVGVQAAEKRKTEQEGKTSNLDTTHGRRLCPISSYVSYNAVGAR